MKDPSASSTRRAFGAAVCALLLTLSAPLTSEGRGNGRGHGHGVHTFSGHHGFKTHGSLHRGSFGHRSFGHRSFGHRSFGHRFSGHRSFGHRSFGHRSFGHRFSPHRFGHRSGHHRFGHRSGHHRFGHRSGSHKFGHRSFGPLAFGPPGFVHHGFGHPGLVHHGFGHHKFGHHSFGHHPLRAVHPYYGDSGYYPAYYRGYEAPQPVAAQSPPIIIIQQPAAPAHSYSGAPVAAPPPYQPPAHNPNALPAKRREPGQLYLWIEQPEAAVYLDEDLLGTGEEVASLDEPLQISAGVHVLSVEHRDFGAERLVFAAPSAEAILIEINLSGNRSGRKARLRSPAEVESRLRMLGR